MADPRTPAHIAETSCPHSHCQLNRRCSDITPCLGMPAFAITISPRKANLSSAASAKESSERIHKAGASPPRCRRPHEHSCTCLGIAADRPPIRCRIVVLRHRLSPPPIATQKNKNRGHTNHPFCDLQLEPSGSIPSIRQHSIRGVQPLAAEDADIPARSTIKTDRPNPDTRALSALTPSRSG